MEQNGKTQENEASRKKILVIEDSPLSFRVFPRRLERIGYRVLTELDATAGIESAKLNLPDAIFFDFRLPGELTSIDAATILKNTPQTAQIPLIVFMVDDSWEHRNELNGTNFDGYLLERPTNSKTIQNLLDKLQ